MGDYIERQAVLNAYDAVQRKNGPWRFETLIESVPAADVRPVVRGRWLHETEIDGHACGECSECHKIRVIDNFCPSCGAEMMGVEQNNA